MPQVRPEHDREDFVKVRRGRRRGRQRGGGGCRGSRRRRGGRSPPRRRSTRRSGGDELADAEGDEALEDADDLADEAEDIEVEGVRSRTTRAKATASL